VAVVVLNRAVLQRDTFSRIGITPGELELFPSL
jgi:hypothetical protein